MISLFPFTIYSTFLVAIAETSGQDASLIGVLRGLGGVAALVVGVALAPLIARWSAPYTTAISLFVLSVTSLIATLGTLSALVLFCLGIGVSTAILTPALLRIATTTYPREGDSGRAATIVTATQSLAAVLAGPIIGVIGLWNGWHGTLWITAMAAAAIAVLFLRPHRKPRTQAGTTMPYVQAFVQLRRRSDLLSLIGVAFLRTSSFMGYLAFLALHFNERFGLEPVAFTLVWTLSGAAFFSGNYLAGRWARTTVSNQRRLLNVGLAGATIAVLTVFTTDLLPLALTATALMGFSHAIVAALVTTLIAGRGGAVTTPAFSINAAGMSLGVFVGAFIAGVGFTLAGSLGMAVALAIPTMLAFVLVSVATATGSANRR
ncbi:MAG TPA: MFS transporter [Candidatus Agrococcus pullicola]|uniref:MFS transporter n=1 Tax=Candidatus Agrococcus pullicola TaxID=2838429 RepID=A0A9D2CA66_9MICO|nr:MFS transporter [Candidatus Agrococcus pullicola]